MLADIGARYISRFGHMTAISTTARPHFWAQGASFSRCHSHASSAMRRDSYDGELLALLLPGALGIDVEPLRRRIEPRTDFGRFALPARLRRGA